MKTKTFFLVLMLVSYAGTILRAENLERLPQATTWYGITMRTGSVIPSTFQSVMYYLDGDTVINGVVYRAFRREDGVCCAGLRQSEDGQQVYIHPTEALMQDPYWEQGEHLLYNFDVQTGDTVYAFDGSYAGIDNMGSDVSLQYRWIVQDVQTISGRKHVFVLGGQSGHLVEWIEGIGTSFILFENVYEDAIWNTYSTYALCVADSIGNILYSFDTDYLGIHNNCPNWEPTGISQEVLPTPSATKLFRDGQLLIFRNGQTYSADGKRLY